MRSGVKILADRPYFDPEGSAPAAIESSLLEGLWKRHGRSYVIEDSSLLSSLPPRPRGCNVFWNFGKVTCGTYEQDGQDKTWLEVAHFHLHEIEDVGNDQGVHVTISVYDCMAAIQGESPSLKLVASRASSLVLSSCPSEHGATSATLRSPDSTTPDREARRFSSTGRQRLSCTSASYISSFTMFLAMPPTGCRGLFLPGRPRLFTPRHTSSTSCSSFSWRVVEAVLTICACRLRNCTWRTRVPSWTLACRLD